MCANISYKLCMTLYNKLLKSTDETRYKKLVATFDLSKNLNVVSKEINL